MHLRQHIKNLMLPIAMVGGAIFYPWMENLTWLSPYLIFVMLTITYCRLDFSHIRTTRGHWVLLAVQMLLSVAAYVAFIPAGHLVSEGVFICVFIPTATAAPVITAMLGGSISSLVTYSLMTNIVMAIAGPLVLAAVGDNADITYLQSYLLIMKKVFPLLILPMLLAFLMEKLTPKIHSKIANQQIVSFYVWCLSLFIVVGSSVAFAINHYTPSNLPLMLLLAGGSLLVCLIQYVLGRRIGERYGMKVSAAQGLFQKNTVLAIWLALTYMQPIASIAPAAYVGWQNIINSWQVARHRREETIA